MIPVILAAMAVASAGIQMYNASKDRKAARALQAKQPKYEINPYVKHRLGLAQTMLGAKSAGAKQMEGDIMQTQANTVHNAQRAATSGAQLLAAGDAAQAQTNRSLGQLAMYEDQNQWRNVENMNQALAEMSAEKEKEYKDKFDKYLIAQNMKQAYMNAARQGTQNGIASIMSAGNQLYSAYGSTAGSGGAGSIFNKPATGGIGGLGGASQIGVVTGTNYGTSIPQYSVMGTSSPFMSGSYFQQPI